MIVRAAAFCLLGAFAAGPHPVHAEPPASGEQDASASASASESASAPKATDGRLIARYDFEDAAAAPIEFPHHFRRTVAPGRGLPPFGTIRLDNQESAEGDWSFRFELERGSLSAGIPTGVLPILPLADYEVSVQVRTDRLRRSGAILRAAFHDALGRRIPESELRSAPIRTGGRWETVTLLLPGRFENAADLVIDLELLQASALERADETDAPQLEDIGGVAWFDDLRIRHLPRLELRMANETTVIIAPERPTLELVVRDMAGEPVETWATVRDIDGRVILHQLLTSSPPHTAAQLELDLDEYGWYDATLLAANKDGILRLARLPFLWLPPVPTFETGDPGFVRPGLIAPSIRTESLGELPAIVRGLRAKAINIPVWDEHVDDTRWTSRWPKLRKALDGMMDEGARLTLGFLRVPRTMANGMNVNEADVPAALAKPIEQWKPTVEPILLPFGIRVTRWQCGSVGATRGRSDEGLERDLAAVRKSMAALVPGVELVVPVDADGPLLDPDAVPDVRIHVPYAVRPESIDTAAERWIEGRRSFSVALEPLPAESFAPRQRAVDLALRALHAWALEPTEVLLEGGLVDRPEGVRTDLTAAVWRTLADRLAGRRFAGTIDLGEDAHGWLFEGDDHLEGHDACLVVWTDHEPLGGARRMALVLGVGRMIAYDIFGNGRPIPFVRGAHEVAIDHSPTFIEGVDPRLVHFRNTMRIEPKQLPTAHRAHDSAIVVHNPWPSDVVVKLEIDESGLGVMPESGRMVIAPGEEARMPIRLVVPVGAERGLHWIDATAELQAEHRYRLRVRMPIMLDWPGVHSTVSWQLGPRSNSRRSRDLMVIQQVTNLTDETLNLDVAMRAPGVPHMRRLIASLAPGMTASRAFQIPDGERLLSGRRVWVTLGDRQGPNQVTEIVRVPPLLAPDASPDRTDEGSLATQPTRDDGP